MFLRSDHALARPLAGAVDVRDGNTNCLSFAFSWNTYPAQANPVAHSRFSLAYGLQCLDKGDLRHLSNGDKQEAVMMGSNVYEDQRIKELFDARFTVNEILERTGLTIDRIVKAINAPRVLKGLPGMKLRQSS